MKNILVFLEYEKGQLKSTSAEAATAGAEIATKAGVEAIGVAINDGAADAGKFGLKKVVNVKHEILNNYSSQAAAKAVAEAAEKNNAGIVLFSANAKGLELAPRVAVRMEAGYIADCTAIEFNGGITVKKPIYAGKSVAEMKAETENQVFSIRPNIIEAKETGADAPVEEFAPALSADDAKVIVKSVNKNEGKLDVAEADIIVSGGRGLKEEGNFGIVEELAGKLGAAVGASRAVVDAEWRPHSEQVGQTGKTVSPSLYVACGISGAIQHLAGMSGSKKIAAINKDKDAPIFNSVDVGIVGDAMTVIPKIIAKL
jgi:electron transfer flavoprotein alpha subunit